jgi:hypothetical protein
VFNTIAPYRPAPCRIPSPNGRTNQRAHSGVTRRPHRGCHARPVADIPFSDDPDAYTSRLWTCRKAPPKPSAVDPLGLSLPPPCLSSFSAIGGNETNDAEYVSNWYVLSLDQIEAWNDDRSRDLIRTTKKPDRKHLRGRRPVSLRQAIFIDYARRVVAPRRTTRRRPAVTLTVSPPTMLGAHPGLRHTQSLAHNSQACRRPSREALANLAMSR